MSVTVNGVVGKERWENFKKGRSAEGPWVTIEYLVPFAQSDDFADGIMGGISVTGTPPNQTIRNNPRHKCPTNPTLYAVQVEEIGYVGERNSGGGGRPTFELAVVKVHYGILSWPQAFADDPGGQQAFPIEANPGQPLIFADCEIDYAEEIVLVPGGSLEYLSDAKKVDVPLGIRVGVTTYRITRHNYPNLPHSKVRTLVGGINSTTTYSKFLGENEGHVRFAGGKTKFTLTSDGTKCQMFEMTFEAREHDWNFFVRPDGYTWEKIVSSADHSTPPYTYRDLSGLLT